MLKNVRPHFYDYQLGICPEYQPQKVNTKGITRFLLLKPETEMEIMKYLLNFI